MNHRRFEEELQSSKQITALEALFRAARLANELALVRARTRQKKGLPVRTAHTTLFPHIDLEGTRISTLAERVGVSKQAVSELVEELGEMGIVEKVADPTDGRAKLVVFTKAGRKGILEGLALLRELEADLACQLGKKKMLTLRNLLGELLPLLTPE